MAINSAIAALGNALLADSGELRHKIASGEVTEQQFYRGLLRLTFGRFFEGLNSAPSCELGTGTSSREAAEQIFREISAVELGAAYESLLEMRLSIDTDSWEVELGRAGQHDRKASGSYYTPSELVESILDWTLDPAISEALSGDEPESALLDLKILDPACGSGHFLTAAADRVGFALATLRFAQSTPSDGEIKRARRDVVQNCIYGVDIDPIAVELCKFALSSGSGDCRIRCGDSLLGLTPKMLAQSDQQPPDTGEHSAFQWHLEFPEVFKGGRANPATGWLGGFDVVIGNPPFLNQLETTTAQSKELATFLKRRYPGVAKGYADTAVIFAELSSQVVRADGGRFGLVQPASILASADTKGARRSLTNRGTLETLWAAREGVFDASVRTCAIVFRNGEERSTTELRRFTGLDFRALVPLRTNTDEIAGMETWAPLISDGFGIPRVDLDESQTMSAVLNATADFRDQYYGLVGFVEDANGRVPDGVNTAALITTGLIDPAELHWGNRSTKFNKTDYTAPLVDLNRLRSESELGDWAANRLVPKLLLATQTRVIEVAVDEAGVLLPSVPVITVTTHGISLWHAAAALMSPPITAWAAARYMGAALSIDALKLSASQVLGLPLPANSAAWDSAAELIRDASGSSSSQKRTQKLQEAGALMCDAYRVCDADQLMNWWRGRLNKERS